MKMRISIVTCTMSLGALTGCSTAGTEIPLAQRIANAAPAATVQARGETEPVGTSNADAADDPAIWRNPADPSASLIVGTDKKAGIYVYGLDGKVRSFTNAGAVNNVDLRPDVSIGGQPGILVAASDRNDLTKARVALLRLDPATGGLTPLGKVEAGAGEAYGICLYRDAAGLYAFVVLKDGTINQIGLDLGGGVPSGRVVRSMKLATQAEGCVADERTGLLYVAEEDVGLWRFDARETGDVAAISIAKADSVHLVADAEGLALAPKGQNDGYLIASSQGDNAYTLYRLSDSSYAGRFRIMAGPYGATEETDGIELATGNFGPEFPGGLFVVQDGYNPASAQNFKLVAWDDVLKALGVAN